MKKSLLITIALIHSILMYAQDFEGIIVYKTSYQIKDSSYSLESLRSIGGTKTTTYLKNGFYKEISDSKFMSYHLFRYDKKAIFFKHQMDDDTLRVQSIKAKNPGPFRYEVVQNSDTIMGVLCDKLIFWDRNGKKTYYYSKDYSLNPRFYRKFTASHKNKIQKITGAMYLKIKIEFDGFNVIHTAHKIDRQKLPAGTFDLPEYQVKKVE